MPKDTNVHDFGELDKIESHQMDLKTIPDVFDGVIAVSEIRDDNYRDPAKPNAPPSKNKALFITVFKDGDEEQVITQKFTATTVGEFKDSLTALGFDSIPVPSPMLVWTKTKLGRAINERWIPTAKSQKVVPAQ